MKKLLILLLICGVALTGCTRNTSDEVISVSGSTSVADYFGIIAKEYQALTNVYIEYEAIGSTGGIENANNGVTTFGTASRNLKPEEEAYGMEDHVIAYDGIAVVVPVSNPVDSLTIQQVHDIYNGTITNWSEVGGPDMPIVVVSREAGSGTRSSFEDAIGLDDSELTADALIAQGNGNVATTTATNPNAIGYVSFFVADENSDSLKEITIDGVEPTAANVQNETYSLFLPFHIVYHQENLSPTDEQFINWLLNEGVYYLAPRAGLIPPPPIQ